uniref:Fibrinogen C-terminal domain-containing protein n=1 Tax=Meleagris gallopavo TaxID=9103 RepID=A0A803YMH2_MELGA
MGNNVIRSKLSSELKTCLLAGFCSKPHCPELWNPNRIMQEEIAHTGQCFWQTLLVKCRAKPPGDFLYPYPADCAQMQQNGNISSGMYTIYLSGNGSRPMQVYCDMTTDGGGWIVFQRRSTGELDFYKRWKNYVEGFGDPTGEFWLGLDQLHNLTSSSPIHYELRVDLRTANESAYAVYDFFQVASSRERYRLSVGNYRGNAGDAMTYHNGWKFTTWDRDNDVALSNCALTHHGAWWYKNCHLANLNGKYGESKHSEVSGRGVNWEPWKGHEFSIPFTEMKIRPQSSSNESVLARKKRSLPGKKRKIRF